MINNPISDQKTIIYAKQMINCKKNPDAYTKSAALAIEKHLDGVTYTLYIFKKSFKLPFRLKR